MRDDDRVRQARVLVELGDLLDAELLLAEALDEAPSDLTALSLFAKIKHMRGELSQAIACWAQIHGRSPHNELTLMQLGALLHMVQNPERGAEEFLALGQMQLVRKPTAHVEMEEVFSLFVARRPDAARARCEQLAKKYQGKDRELFKMTVMAGAWIAEMSGELDAACQSLERLGHERGFELDTDRLLSLVRCYERTGQPEKLQSAVSICEHMMGRFEKISLLGRLAVLHRRLGDEARAKEHGDRYLDAFRRRMHRPTFEDVVRVASTRHLPLDRLRALRFGPRELPEDLSLRARALGAALSGDVAAAREGFAQGKEPLDRKYLGDLTWMEGNHEDAIACYVQALRDDPEDVVVLARVLDTCERLGVEGRVNEQVANLLLSPQIAERAQRAVDAAIRVAPLRSSHWRTRARLWSVQQQSRQEVARSHDRADALAEAERREASPIGRVLAAGVYNFVGKSKGLMHQVWAHRETAERGRGGALLGDQILGNLTHEMRQGVRNTFLAVREYAQAKFPHMTRDLFDYHYGYKVTKDDEPSGGLSAGLPTALAFLSVFLQRPVPQDIASTGVMVADAHDVLAVRSVGDAEYKVRGAYNCRLRMLLLPAANRAALLESPRVPPTITEEMVRWVGNLDDAVRLVFGEDIFVTG